MSIIRNIKSGEEFFALLKKLSDSKSEIRKFEIKVFLQKLVKYE